jgi:hypothetical protein
MLERVDDGLWVVPAPLTFLGLRIGTRMTVVRLGGGEGARELWIHSAVPLTPELKREVDALGSVAHVVAPDLFHHLFASQWSSAYPSAVFYAPAALGKKRKDLRIGLPLERAAEAPWAKELAPLRIAGCMLGETVFVHAKARTLVTADLVENFATSPHWPTRLYLKAAGIHGKLGFSRALRPIIHDRRAARRSIDELLERDFDRIVLCHGDVLPQGGRDGVREAFAFLGS